MILAGLVIFFIGFSTGTVTNETVPAVEHATQVVLEKGYQGD